MGAGASAASEYDENIVENSSKVIEETSNQLDNSLEALGGQGVDVNIQLDNFIVDVGGSVAEGAQDGVKSILESVRGHISSEQLTAAYSDFKEALPNLQGDAIFAGLAASLQAAAEMSGPVVSSVGAAILVLGEHLPYIAVAAGAIGAIVYTFKLSKDYDENVKNVSFWMASVKDWLMLVASKISASGAASTMPLFKGLEEAMLSINSQIDEWKSKWRITKMLSSSTFERDFTRLKTTIMELKTALRDYLDEETQQRQETQLGEISSLQVETNEKLNSMDEQLVLIRAMLEAQEESRLKKEQEDNAQKEINAKTEVKDEVERIFFNIQKAAGVNENSPVDFRSFVFVFETFFYGGSDMPPEQRRGLKIAVDRDQTNFVSKAAWVKFYHQWTEAHIEIETYLNKIAEDNPTLFLATKAKAVALAGKGMGVAKEKLAQAGIENTDDAKKLVAEGLNQLGGKFSFGKKKEAEQ